MDFSEIILEQEIEENKKITPEMFVLKASEYHSLDLALEELSDDYIQYYFDNQRLVDKALRSQGLIEAAGAEDPGYLGWQPSKTKKTKKIKYKGEIIQLEYNPENGTWVPNVAFRSVTNALKFGKLLADMVET